MGTKRQGKTMTQHPDNNDNDAHRQNFTLPYLFLVGSYQVLEKCQDSWWSLVGMGTNSTKKMNQDFHRIPGGFLVDFGRNEYNLE